MKSSEENFKSDKCLHLLNEVDQIYNESVLNEKVIQFNKIINTTYDIFKVKNHSIKNSFIDWLLKLWHLIKDSKGTLKGILFFYEYFRFYKETFSLPFNVLLNILQKILRLNEEICTMFEDICNDTEFVKLFWSKNLMKTPDIHKETSMCIIAKSMALDLVFRKENTIFDQEFYKSFPSNRKMLHKINRLSVTEIFKIYFFAKKSKKDTESIKLFLPKLDLLFQKENINSFIFLKNRNNLPKIIYSLICDYSYEILSSEDLHSSLSLYFHLQTDNIIHKINPIEFVIQYQKFFQLKKFDKIVFIGFNEYLRNLFNAITGKNNEDSFILHITHNILDYLITKFFTKDQKMIEPNLDKWIYFFYLEEFILYMNFLYNYGEGVFSLFCDKYLSNFFFEKVFDILYLFVNVKDRIAIMAINYGYQLYKNFHRNEKIIIEKFIILVASCSIYYCERLDLNNIISELISENDFHNYFFKSNYYSTFGMYSSNPLSKSSKKIHEVNTNKNSKSNDNSLLPSSKNNTILNIFGKGVKKEDNQLIDSSKRKYIFSLNSAKQEKDNKNIFLENFLSRIIFTKPNELHVYLLCIKELIELEGHISNENIKRFKEVFNFFFSDYKISEYYYTYRNYEVPNLFFGILQKIDLSVNERVVILEKEFNNLSEFHLYLIHPNILKNRESRDDHLFKLKNIFKEHFSFYIKEFVEEIDQYYESLLNRKIFNPIITALFNISLNIKIQDEKDQFIVRMLIYIYRLGYFKDEISMVLSHFSLFYPMTNTAYSLSNIISYLNTLLEMVDSELLVRFVSVYLYIDKSLRSKVESFKITLGHGEKLREDIEIIFMKYIKHPESKFLKNKHKYIKILNKTKVTDEKFINNCKKAKYFYDINVDFFSKINFTILTQYLQKFGLHKINYLILEKVINMKNFLKQNVSNQENNVYINTLRSLESNHFFEECIDTAGFLKFEKQFTSKELKNSIDNYLLNLDRKQYRSFLFLPPEEITLLYFFKLKILNVVDHMINGKLHNTREELNNTTEQFICNSFLNKNYITLVQEMNLLLQILWNNNFKSMKDVSSNNDIYDLFRSNEIDDNPENLFHLQIRRVLCQHLKFIQLELNYILNILKIYKCRNEKEMVEKYLNLYEKLTSSSNDIIETYNKLKYLYFLGKINEFNEIFRKKFDPINYFTKPANSIWEIKMIMMKFQIEFNNKISDDDSDHSSVLLFIEKNQEILRRSHDSNRELEAKLYYIAGNFKVFHSFEYSDIQSMLKDLRDKIFIDIIQSCCKYFLLAAYHTKKFKYLFKLLPISIKLFKIVYECKPSHGKDKDKYNDFIKEYSQIILTLEIDKIAFIFQFLVDYGTELPFHLELIIKFTNKYPNYSIYSLLSTYGLEEPHDSNQTKADMKKSNFSDILRKIKSQLQPTIKKNLDSSIKFLRLLFKFKKGNSKDTDRYNKISKAILEINELLAHEEVLLPKNVFDLVKFKGSEYNPSNAQKEYIIHIDKKFDIYNSLAQPVKLVFEINENGKHRKVPYIFKSDKEVHLEIVAAEFFECCNKILKFNKNTKYLNLNMSLYQIVKLDSESLIIEFIENTTMLKSLISREWVKCGQTLDLKYPEAEEIRDKFSKWTRPENLNFPNYFIDKFNDPNVFFEHKINFIKSTAMWSIAGYLIGLGDRHCQNILVKQNSEIVHIDYGVILGRGKVLPVPEVVQFRLTPNISQGLDIFQGKTLFYYYCYIILNAFIKEKGSVFEILETVYKVNSKTNDVKSLIKKLENGSYKDVLKLIESCSDSEKLKKMYKGWAPWC